MSPLLYHNPTDFARKNSSAKRNDPWPHTVRPRVTSVHSWYLTSFFIPLFPCLHRFCPLTRKTRNFLSSMEDPHWFLLSDAAFYDGIVFGSFTDLHYEDRTNLWFLSFLPLFFEFSSCAWAWSLPWKKLICHWSILPFWNFGRSIGVRLIISSDCTFLSSLIVYHKKAPFAIDEL